MSPTKRSQRRGRGPLSRRILDLRDQARSLALKLANLIDKIDELEGYNAFWRAYAERQANQEDKHRDQLARDLQERRE